ncbi:MAG TPA: hypothetical protein VG860_00530 [Terriglobia bacterium]|jgi:hypothetical protein|nr:hypothetical protein [Terriglobia bacterium]
MRVRFEALLVTLAVVLGLAGLASAGAKEGPVGGTWSCVAHGTGEGDMEYTFDLTQAAEQVTGKFTAPSPDGGTASHDVQNGSFKSGKLELHFDDDEGTITVTGGLDGKDAMKGDWTQGTEGGTWDCKRAPAAPGK